MLGRCYLWCIPSFPEGRSLGQTEKAAWRLQKHQVTDAVPWTEYSGLQTLCRWRGRLLRTEVHLQRYWYHSYFRLSERPAQLTGSGKCYQQVQGTGRQRWSTGCSGLHSGWCLHSGVLDQHGQEDRRDGCRFHLYQGYGRSVSTLQGCWTDQGDEGSYQASHPVAYSLYFRCCKHDLPEGSRGRCWCDRYRYESLRYGYFTACYRGYGWDLQGNPLRYRSGSEPVGWDRWLLQTLQRWVPG